MVVASLLLRGGASGCSRVSLVCSFWDWCVVFSVFSFFPSVGRRAGQAGGKAAGKAGRRAARKPGGRRAGRQAEAGEKDGGKAGGRRPEGQAVRPAKPIQPSSASQGPGRPAGRRAGRPAGRRGGKAGRRREGRRAGRWAGKRREVGRRLPEDGMLEDVFRLLENGRRMSSDFRLPEMQKTSSDVRLPYGRRKREVFRLPGRSPEDGRRKWSGNPAFRLGRKISSFFKALFF